MLFHKHKWTFVAAQSAEMREPGLEHPTMMWTYILEKSCCGDFRTLKVDGNFQEILNLDTPGISAGERATGTSTTDTCGSIGDGEDEDDRAPNGADRGKYNAYQREYKRRKRAQ